MSQPAQTFRLKNLAKDQLVALSLLLGLIFYTVWDQIYWWGEREDYSFGYLVPLFVAYVLYDRWPVIQSYLVDGVAPGK